MPRYVKNDRVIFASEKAYKAIYEEQGYLPEKTVKHDEDEENSAPDTNTVSITDTEGVSDDEQDDYEDDTNAENEGSKDNAPILDPNDAMPLSARIGLLTYEQLKEKAKELGIPKYANTKREDLATLIIEAMETDNA